jgi:Cu/Ag efflux protein CusF
MKTSITAILFLAFTASQAMAQPKAEVHSVHRPASAASAAVDMTDGEVRKVDKAQAKITLKHGEIKALDMPPMTMVFQVKDKAWLDRLKPGDKVRFSAANESGRLIVTAIEARR